MTNGAPARHDFGYRVVSTATENLRTSPSCGVFFLEPSNPHAGIMSAVMQDRLADAGTAVSVSSAVWVWVAHATAVAQLAVAIVGVIAGVASAVYYILKIREHDQ